MAASPGVAKAMYRMSYGLDIRDALPSIQSPTLVIHSADNEYVTADNATVGVEGVVAPT